MMGGSRFQFEPCGYGPFDKSVYEDLDLLVMKDKVILSGTPAGPHRTYSASYEGQIEGQELLKKLDSKVQSYAEKISEFVRSCSFEQLVSAVYKKYPDMKVNSVFSGASP